ncbi:MAG: hypothetical protein M3Q05_11870, partial [Bacteroidota bacterium]|nr:hypothetical protein [Bacteroidota bacterium]
MEGYSKVDDILDRSDDLTEVMAQIPNWIVRSGMTYLFITLVAILTVSWFIRYPDVLTSDVVLTSPNPPARIIAQSSGKLHQIFFKENDYVQKGALLGIIENSANSSDVLGLLSLLNSTPYSDLINNQNLDLFDNNNLGEVQMEYANFYRAYNDLKLFKQLNPVARELTSTRQEFKEHHNLLNKQLKEKEFYKTEIGLVQKDYDRNVFLYKNKVIADKQLEDNEREL